MTTRLATVIAALALVVPLACSAEPPNRCAAYLDDIEAMFESVADVPLDEVISEMMGQSMALSVKYGLDLGADRSEVVEALGCNDADLARWDSLGSRYPSLAEAVPEDMGWAVTARGLRNAQWAQYVQQDPAARLVSVEVTAERLADGLDTVRTLQWTLELDGYGYDTAPIGSCAENDDSIYDTPEVGPGRAVTFTVCFKVPLDADTGAAATLHVSDWTAEVAVEVGP